MPPETPLATSLTDLPSTVRITWGRMLVGAILGGIAIWLASRGVSWDAVGEAFASARLWPILLATFTILAILLLKGWRWQLLYFPRSLPPLPDLLWAMMAGQFVNLVSPIRVGEVARILGLERSVPGIKAHSLGTIVVEKALDSILLALTVALILPLIAVPDYLARSVTTMLIIAGVAMGALYLIAFRTQWVVRVMRFFLKFVPDAIAPRLERIAISGLEGLSALRNHRQNGLVVGVSAAIAFLSILPAYLLFFAFSLEFGLVTAAMLHVVLTLGLLPPSTPGKLFIFEAVTQGVLIWLGVNESIGLSYAIVFHLVVILPQIVLGIVAVIRYDWRFSQILSGRSRQLGSVQE